MAAVKVRFYGTAVAHAEGTTSAAKGQHFNPQFVPQDAGVIKKGLPPPVRVQVGTTNANPVYPYKGFIGL